MYKPNKRENILFATMYHDKITRIPQLFHTKGQILAANEVLTPLLLLQFHIPVNFNYEDSVNHQNVH